MEFIRKLKSKLGIVMDLTHFLWERKLWWLIPIILVIVMIGLVLVMSAGTPIAPFIYTLF